MLMKEEVIFESPPVKLPVGFIKNGVKLKNNIRNNINHNNNIVKMSEVKTNSGACIKYVHSKVTLYYSSRIELKWRRALHHCQTCDFGDVSVNGVMSPCGAIHRGVCTPVTVEQLMLPQRHSRPAAHSSRHHHTKTGSSHIGLPTGKHHSTSHVPSSHSSSLYVQTISNGTVSKDKDSILRDIREKGQEKENTDINIQNNSATHTLDTLSSPSRESRTKKKDNSSRQSKSVIPNANIPKFHFPMGRPSDKNNIEEVLLRVSQEFSKAEGGKITKQQMGIIAKTCGLPLYWKCPLFNASGGNKQGFITYQMFSSMWKRLNQTCHDQAALFVMLLAKPGTNYIEDDDLVPLLQDVVDTHPGLTFLLEAPEFHSRYVNTVIARIMYCVNRSWTGKVTIPELRKSNFLTTLSVIEEEDDINQITDFFSYEHFYVIYCKFWELDKDHDLFIDKTDLARHNEHAISTRMIERIFSGAVTRGKTFEEGKMSYPEFVWFLLSEEDKKHPTSIEYWFRCMDFDGDGLISMYEMEYFYEEQMQKMEALGIERLPFEDCLCQMLDLVQPESRLQITLKDLKRCKMTNIFFDTFMNLDKFLEHEQRDPFANLRDLESDVPEPTDWEKYAAEEYEILVAEEGANEQEEIHYEDDFEPDDEETFQDSLTLNSGDKRPSDPIQGRGLGGNPSVHTIEDDIYDFSNSSTY
ncbi:serine/threonine-protein phosphatase 2A regulatory subunit B'' subunit beta-like isoform X1 [Mercenaria mercenaria]|uniref:serine/threonine-protein phosphatase 2A regulatory subunit B'' subunit beta-like isoform X1 n=1 Tax=Mercenaria mercenaria TaxID=6596 RepID=UPI00234F1CF8|nr:serine/threonine-protein phosphatase 2A regulatory subunit B'' subunit beta-like isoform X1 [Mercenaria mercenaria]XP_053403495.1 serine/threonine-protein phosphatase 2A regulatory subunit B'' subunit beta-like isoform X1 [Mercenaria mercenaria]XP_053403497.1 serine/threonine-protein phosphatase 2A regulatory subunit B'' subunit beta-like isoform X1 [Mercenaria mercenaria]XP_053403498.1 serine/threonine-protein phosphatase 2A regulatory subunit B'' subunit beta-like isoform X1 [Mercenaria mer